MSLLSRLRSWLRRGGGGHRPSAARRLFVEELERRELLATTPAIFIDSTWLAARGAGPYVLDQAGATYVLETDLRTAGTALVVGAAGITLDLNGHTVTYGDSAPLNVPNGGFESGTGRNVPGWNLSGAPAATVAPDTSLLFGQQVLRLVIQKSPKSQLGKNAKQKLKSEGLS